MNIQNTKAQADRWHGSVNYGSVMSAWTQDMFQILKECDGDKAKATEVLAKRKAIG
jgi:hypothetical protein